ncbi:MAG: exo-alpha-sialidase [Lentisphaeria bacterium]|nr:exo-alpha-sialidase [Lentisphaeria bacterium]
MRILDSGTISTIGTTETLRVRTFPSLVALSDGTLLVACKAGSNKDSDDGTIEMFRSSDNGTTWSGPTIPFAPTKVDGLRGSYALCYMTELESGHLLAACMWVDRESYPGKPLFNPDTEGCLPMAILLSDSYDFGNTWTALRKVPLPDEIGPPSLTNPLIKLASGSLLMSIETNKPYTDGSKWHQKVVFLPSRDAGKTWEEAVSAVYDPTGRIFNWDRRVGVAHDGTIATFLWTYDSEVKTYLNIHRRLSSDDGATWSEAEDLGFADQAGPPAVLANGSMVLCWVDRFGSRSIRARFASSVDEGFDQNTEIEIYHHELPDKREAKTVTTGETLEDMGLWTYGLPYAATLPDGNVLIVYYAGNHTTMNVRWCRISPLM